MSALVQCSRPRCTYPVANDGAWAADEAQDVCARHRQLDRNSSGRCPNCGTPMADVAIINDLTGKPRTSGGVPQAKRQCPSCGYEQRPRKPRQPTARQHWAQRR